MTTHREEHDSTPTSDSSDVEKIKIKEFDIENFKIVAVGYGETFDLAKHPQGTEVKAITYSNMQIYDNDEQHEVFVIIDI